MRNDRTYNYSYFGNCYLSPIGVKEDISYIAGSSVGEGKNGNCFLLLNYEVYSVIYV